MAWMWRETSSNARPPLTLNESSPQVRLLRAPLVCVSRSSSCTFRRPPFQLKFAGLSRSMPEVMVGTSPPLLLNCTVVSDVATSTVGASRTNVLRETLACASSLSRSPSFQSMPGLTLHSLVVSTYGRYSRKKPVLPIVTVSATQPVAQLPSAVRLVGRPALLRSDQSMSSRSSLFCLRAKIVSR